MWPREELHPHRRAASGAGGEQMCPLGPSKDGLSPDWAKLVTILRSREGNERGADETMVELASGVELALSNSLWANITANGASNLCCSFLVLSKMVLSSC